MIVGMGFECSVLSQSQSPRRDGQTDDGNARGMPCVELQVVFVPSHDQQAVVRLGPLVVGVDVFLKPRVPLGNAPGGETVVHIVLEAGDDNGNGGQPGEVLFLVGKSANGILADPESRFFGGELKLAHGLCLRA